MEIIDSQKRHNSKPTSQHLLQEVVGLVNEKDFGGVRVFVTVDEVQSGSLSVMQRIAIEIVLAELSPRKKEIFVDLKKALKSF